MVREMIDMEARSFDKVDVQKVNRQIEVEINSILTEIT
jgi:hypothetical protein